MSVQQRRSRESAVNVYLLTLIFPFFGLIYSLVRWRESWARNVFWMACVYMGAVFIFFPEGTVFGQGADGARYAMWLADMYHSKTTIADILSGFMRDSRTMDLYQPLLTYLISRFTDNVTIKMRGTMNICDNKRNRPPLGIRDIILAKPPNNSENAYK